MEAKGRRAKGSSHSQSKLTQEQLDYIKLSSERGVDLARRFGVSPALISMRRSG